MHRLAVPRIGWRNTIVNYVSCSWRLEKEAHVFIVSILYFKFVWQELEMVCAGVSDTVTISYQRWYIKIETLRGKNSNTNPSCFEWSLWWVHSEPWYGFPLGYRFRGGYVSIDSDRRPGRSRTSTDERSVKLVAVALEEDRRATCEDLSRTTRASQENTQQPTSVAIGWAPHSPWQCSPAHRGVVAKKTSRLWVEKCYLMRPTVQAWAQQTSTFSQS